MDPEAAPHTEKPRRLDRFLDGAIRGARTTLVIVAALAFALIAAGGIGRAVRVIFSLKAGAITAECVFLATLIGSLIFGLRATTRQTTRTGEQRAAEIMTDPLLVRVERLRDHLHHSADLFAALQAELEARTAALASLQAEAEHYEHLAALHQEQAHAVQRLIEQTITMGNAQAGRRSFRQQVGFLLGSIVLAIPAGLAGNYLFQQLTN